LIQPLTFLGMMLALTAGMAVASLLARARRAAQLSRLAQSWGMRYVGRDRFDLAPKISERFPVPGAADLAVVDLIYGLESGRHRYVFTVQYTQGVVRTKSRLQRVATFSEPRDADGAEGMDGSVSPSPLHMAPAELPLMQQYAHLRQMLSGAPTKPEDELASPRILFPGNPEESGDSQARPPA